MEVLLSRKKRVRANITKAREKRKQEGQEGSEKDEHRGHRGKEGHRGRFLGRKSIRQKQNERGCNLPLLTFEERKIAPICFCPILKFSLWPFVFSVPSVFLFLLCSLSPLSSPPPRKL